MSTQYILLQPVIYHIDKANTVNTGTIFFEMWKTIFRIIVCVSIIGFRTLLGDIAEPVVMHIDMGQQTYNNKNWKRQPKEPIYLHLQMDYMCVACNFNTLASDTRLHI